MVFPITLARNTNCPVVNIDSFEEKATFSFTVKCYKSDINAVHCALCGTSARGSKGLGGALLYPAARPCVAATRARGRRCAGVCFTRHARFLSMLFMVKTNETLYRESIVAHYINIPETTETSITLARSDSPRVVTSTRGGRRKAGQPRRRPARFTPSQCVFRY